MKSKSFVFLAIVVTIAAIVGGVWFDRSRSEERRALAADTTKTVRQTPPLPQRGELLPTGEGEVSGIAKCGFCYWGAGDKTCNTVLEMTGAPGIVFLLPNEKREELENLTGNCAGGDHDVTARGTITQYNGHNYMLVKNFDARKTK